MSAPAPVASHWRKRGLAAGNAARALAWNMRRPVPAVLLTPHIGHVGQERHHIPRVQEQGNVQA